MSESCINGLFLTGSGSLTAGLKRYGRSIVMETLRHRTEQSSDISDNWECFVSLLRDGNDPLAIKATTFLRWIAHDSAVLTLQVPAVDDGWKNSRLWEFWQGWPKRHYMLLQGLVDQSKYHEWCPSGVDCNRNNYQFHRESEYYAGSWGHHLALNNGNNHQNVSHGFSHRKFYERLGLIGRLDQWAGTQRDNADALNLDVRQSSYDQYYRIRSSIDRRLQPLEQFRLMEGIYGAIRLAWFCLLFTSRMSGLIPTGWDVQLDELALGEARRYMYWARSNWSQIAGDLPFPDVPPIIQEIVSDSLIQSLLA